MPPGSAGESTMERQNLFLLDGVGNNEGKQSKEFTLPVLIKSKNLLPLNYNKLALDMKAGTQKPGKGLYFQTYADLQKAASSENARVY